MSGYYDMNGNPMTLEEWSKAFENDDRKLGNTQLGDVTVSTVWLGLDHSFGMGSGPPVIFETMIFGGPLDQWQQRYSTKEQALKGHIEAIELVLKERK